MLKSRYMTVDPGISGTGVAVWSGSKLIAHYSLYEHTLDNWFDKTWSIAQQLISLVKIEALADVYIELPQHFESFKGVTAEKTGSVIKLSYMVGYFAARINALKATYSGVVLVPVTEWKGQLPKKIVHEQVYKHFPELEKKRISSHALDAIGIGLFKQGKL